MENIIAGALLGRGTGLDIQGTVILMVTTRMIRAIHEKIVRISLPVARLPNNWTYPYLANSFSLLNINQIVELKRLMTFSG